MDIHMVLHSTHGKEGKYHSCGASRAAGSQVVPITGNPRLPYQSSIKITVVRHPPAVYEPHPSFLESATRLQPMMLKWKVQLGVTADDLVQVVTGKNPPGSPISPSVLVISSLLVLDPARKADISLLCASGGLMQCNGQRHPGNPAAFLLLITAHLCPRIEAHHGQSQVWQLRTEEGCMLGPHGSVTVKVSTALPSHVPLGTAYWEGP